MSKVDYQNKVAYICLF